MNAPLPPAEYRHLFEFHTRFGHVDSQGHVNNCHFLTYLEDARIEMFHSDPVRKGEAPIKGMVIARHEIDYKRPLMWSVDPYRVEAWVTELRSASFKLAYEVRDDEHVYAQATSTLVAFDAQAERLRRFTPEERAFIQRYLRPAS